MRCVESKTVNCIHCFLFSLVEDLQIRCIMLGWRQEPFLPSQFGESITFLISQMLHQLAKILVTKIVFFFIELKTQTMNSGIICIITNRHPKSKCFFDLSVQIQSKI